MTALKSAGQTSAVSHVCCALLTLCFLLLCNHMTIITCSSEFTEVKLFIDNTTLLTYNITIPTASTPSFSLVQYNDTDWRNQTNPDETNINSQSPLSIRANTMCACSYCGCNGNTCPLSVYYFTQLVGRNCPSNNVATIGLLSIQSTDSDDGFKYYVTDESNKNLAIARKPFSYLNFVKSMPNSNGVYCAYDSSQKMRLSMNSLYVVSESTNLIFNTYLRYDIDIGCAVPPFQSISTQFSYSGQRVYQDTQITLSIKFVSPYNQIDDWQNGQVRAIKSGNGRTYYANIYSGQGSTTFYPDAIGSSSFSLFYFPNNVYGTYDQQISNLNPYTVYQKATSATLFVQQSSYQISSSSIFPITIKVDYQILDNDGVVTPDVPYRVMQVKTNVRSETMTCGSVASGYGIGSFYCQLLTSYSGTINIYIQNELTYIGSTSLTIVPQCFGKTKVDSTVCSGNGVCAQIDTCYCNPNYGGQQCEIPVCNGELANSPQACNGHGACTVNEGYISCVCNDKWGGQNCDRPKCNGTLSEDPNVCHSNGICLDVDQCSCSSSWSGEWCDIPKCGEIVATDGAVCNGNGKCVNVDTCTCDNSYAGQFCEIPVCNGTLATNANVCSSNGNCTQPDICECNDSRGGKFCEVEKCGGVLATDPTVCSSRGVCTEMNNCECYPGYIGDNCQNLECSFEKPDDVGVSINAPTPIITSAISLTNGVSFVVSFGLDQTIPYEHLLFIGNSKFSVSNCSVLGNYPIATTAVNSHKKCWREYQTEVLKLSDILSHPMVTKEKTLSSQQDEIIKLTIPLTLQYFGRALTDEVNYGICRSFEFKTTQTIYIKSTTLIEASFVEYSPLFPYSAQLYSSESSTIDGVFNIALVLVTGNATLESFTYHNTTSNRYSMQVTNTNLLFKKRDLNYYMIEANSIIAQSDFRATIFFKASLKRKDVLDVVDLYFPVRIDFEMVTPPQNQNFTLQSEMILASDATNWSPKSTFIGNDRVFVKVSSKSFELLENNHLSVKDAYLCCFKEFVVSLPESGCLQNNPNTMDVWKQIITSTSNVNSELSTTIHPFSNSNYAYGFSFQISSSLFPEKLSTTPTTCFVQSRIGTKTSLLAKRNQLEETTTTRASLFLLDLSQKRATSLQNSSNRRLVLNSTLMIVMLMIIYFIA